MLTRTADRKRHEWFTSALTAAAVLFCASAFAKVAGFYMERGRMQGVLSLAQAQREPNDLQRHLVEAKKAADTLKQKNLFIKAPPKENPVKQVNGILGSEALIAGKWYKVGEKIADAKIVAILPTLVKVEWDGKETSFSPMSAASAGPPPGPPVAKEAKKEAGPEPPKPAETKVVKAEAPAEDDPLAWLGVKLSARVRERLLQMWNSASPEEREQRKQEWNSMPEEKKQEAVQMMEQRM